MKGTEEDRLASLDAYDILYSIGGEEFDDLADLAAYKCDTPIAQINFIDEQNQWSLSSCGMEGNTVPREQSFCNKTIQQDDSLIIEDARHDPRFKDNVFVTGKPNIRFYAGINIKSNEGLNLGTLCVIDKQPRQITDQQLECLRKLARQVERQLELRFANKQWEKKSRYLNTTVDLQIEADPHMLTVQELIQDGKTLTSGNGRSKHLTIDELLEDTSSVEYLRDWTRSAGPDSQPLHMETKLSLNGDGTHWYEITGSYTYGKLYITGKNINKWKKFETDLERERKFSQSIVESLPGLLVQFDEEGRLRHWNDNFSHLYEQPDQALEGKHFTEFLPKETHKIARSVYELREFGATYLEVDFPTHEDNQYYYFTFINVQYDREDTYIGIGINISEQVRYEHRLEEALDDKTALLSEVHHRVKNNLAIISGLLELESDNYDSDLVKKSFQKSHLRIQSMAKIHEKLYGNQQFSTIPVNRYLDELLDIIATTFDPNDNIDIELVCAPISLNINQSIPMALMINELVTNAFQHAFEQGEEGTIRITVEEENDTLLLNITDTGKGFPDDYNMDQSSTLGSTLIKTLVQQVEGKVEVIDPSQSHIRIAFPILNQQGAHSHGNWE